VVSKFLSGLSPTLRSQVRGQILGDSIFTLTATFSRVMRVSLELIVFSAPSIEQSVMISGCGRGRGRGRDFRGRGRGFVGGGRGSYEDRVPLRKDPGNASTVDAIITSPRSAERNLIDLSGQSYLSLILLLRIALLRTIHSLPLLFLDLPLLY